MPLANSFARSSVHVGCNASSAAPSSPSSAPPPPSAAPFLRLLFRSDWQRFEQHLTSSQQFSHFFRQVNGRLQTTQTLVGRLCGLRKLLSEAMRTSGGALLRGGTE